MCLKKTRSSFALWNHCAILAGLLILKILKMSRSVYFICMYTYYPDLTKIYLFLYFLVQGETELFSGSYPL